jgi:phosphatidylserine decarboxylase
MIWDFAEANPLSFSCGNWDGACLEWVSKALEALPRIGSGLAAQSDAATQLISVDKLVSTDPPYYDNIGYADLSDFFYVWLRRSLRPVFPDLFATLAVPKAEELVATPYRHGSKEQAETFFLDGMTQAMHRLAEQAHPAFPVTIYYAFKQSESDDEEGTASTGWDTFLAAVIEAGFAVTGTWPMRTERGARSVGSAPTAAAAHRGLEDRRVKLGCVMPGEAPAVFGDALRRLAAAATYLYQDGPRFWYSTQPTVTKLAEDRAEQLKRDPDKVAQELDERLRADLRKIGDFSRIHPLPRSGADVPDDLDARLVVLPAEHTYTKDAGSAAETAARAILESRGNTPRLYRNTLVFLAADKVRLQDLDEAVRRFLAWESILVEKESLNLDPHQVRQAETQKQAADGAVTARLPETYQWLLVPEQANPQAAITWQAVRLSGSESLAVRASKKLRSDESMVLSLGSTILRKHLDAVPLWRGDHVAVKQLVEDFARYLYLPRVAGPEVLVQAIRDGVALLTWQADTFAYAESHDDGAGRYPGLRGGQVVALSAEGTGLLVKPGVAQRQLDAEAPAATSGGAVRGDLGADAAAAGAGATVSGSGGAAGPATAPTAPLPRRFHGTVRLDAARVGRDASRIADEVIAHLAGQVGAEVTVTLEVEAKLPGGASDQIVRTVTENSRTLKFTSHGFEAE